MSFTFAYVVSALVLIGLAVLAGKASDNGVLGILVDTRGRYSLNHLQIVMWTILVLSTFLAVFAVTGDVSRIPDTPLALMGIAAGTAATAGAVKGAKDTNPEIFIAETVPRARRNRPATPEGVEPPGAKVSQVYLEEEGDQADRTVSVTKFQNLIFTAALGVAYVALTLKTGGYAEFDDTALWLIGISHAGYVTGKIPNKS